MKKIEIFGENLVQVKNIPFFIVKIFHNGAQKNINANNLQKLYYAPLSIDYIDENNFVKHLVKKDDWRTGVLTLNSKKECRASSICAELNEKYIRFGVDGNGLIIVDTNENWHERIKVVGNLPLLDKTAGEKNTLRDLTKEETRIVLRRLVKRFKTLGWFDMDYNTELYTLKSHVIWAQTPFGNKADPYSGLQTIMLPNRCQVSVDNYLDYNHEEYAISLINLLCQPKVYVGRKKDRSYTARITLETDDLISIDKIVVPQNNPYDQFVKDYLVKCVVGADAD